LGGPCESVALPANDEVVTLVRTPASPVATLREVASARLIVRVGWVLWNSPADAPRLPDRVLEAEY